MIAAAALPVSVDPAIGPKILRLLAAACAIGALFAPTAPVALGALAAGLVLHAATAGSRTGGVLLALAALATVIAAGAAATGNATAAFAGSLVALAIRSGAWPLHLGVAATADRRPGALVDLSASLPAAVFVHVGFIVPLAPDVAHAAAPLLVVAGAASALVCALASLSATDLRTLWSGVFAMHGGMMMAAIAVAGRGHLAAAVFVAVSFALALGGLGTMVEATEARTGPVSLRPGGGRSDALPRVAWTFAFFAAASVALPGTIGFAADDLLLHALWDESPVASTLMLAASALLAVALLRGFSAAYLGRSPTAWTADDLALRERAHAALLIALLLFAGVYPSGLLSAVSTAFPPPLLITR